MFTFDYSIDTWELGPVKICRVGKRIQHFQFSKLVHTEAFDYITEAQEEFSKHVRKCEEAAFKAIELEFNVTDPYAQAIILRRVMELTKLYK